MATPKVYRRVLLQVQGKKKKQVEGGVQADHVWQTKLDHERRERKHRRQNS